MKRTSGRSGRRPGSGGSGGSVAVRSKPGTGRAEAGASRETEAGLAASANLNLYLLGGLVLLHLTLALLSFDPTPHTGGDNAAYIALAESILGGEGYLEVYDPGSPPHTQYPPAFPLLIAAAMAVGITSWVGLKLLVVGTSAIGVGATYLWLSRRNEPLLALGVTLVLAVSPIVLELSHWVLSDVPFWALTAVALWAYSGLEEGAGGERAPLIIAVIATVLAYFTRSAGLPLVFAGGGWLLWQRRWRDLGALAIVLVPLALWWWLRARGQGGVDYVNQFWFVDPYNPDLGSIGLAGLFTRIWENLVKYVSIHLPLLLAGRVGGAAFGLSVAVSGAAVVGWALRVRRPGVTELFFPLYLGLILVWPAVWSGERFLLPAYPLLLGYGAEALVVLVRRVRSGAVLPTGALVAASMIVLALPGTGKALEVGSTCMARYRAGDPYPCLDPVWRDFYSMADWARAELPDDAVVISRKPRLFYGLSERRGLIYPFSQDPANFFAAVERSGARYLVLDQLGGVSARFVGPALNSEPGAFCLLEVAPGQHAALLGIMPESEWRDDARAGEFVPCPASYLRAR